MTWYRDSTRTVLSVIESGGLDGYIMTVRSVIDG